MALYGLIMKANLYPFGTYMFVSYVPSGMDFITCTSGPSIFCFEIRHSHQDIKILNFYGKKPVFITLWSGVICVIHSL